MRVKTLVFSSVTKFLLIRAFKQAENNLLYIIQEMSFNVSYMCAFLLVWSGICKCLQVSFARLLSSLNALLVFASD